MRQALCLSRVALPLAACRAWPAPRQRRIPAARRATSNTQCEPPRNTQHATHGAMTASACSTLCLLGPFVLNERVQGTAARSQNLNSASILDDENEERPRPRAFALSLSVQSQLAVIGVLLRCDSVVLLYRKSGSIGFSLLVTIETLKLLPL